jgi:GTPase involved in cell partitioning and DNA repair
MMGTPGDGVCESADAPDVCSLRAATNEITALPGQDVINLPAGTHVLTVGALQIIGDLSLKGENADITLIRGNGGSGIRFIGSRPTVMQENDPGFL